MIGLWAWFDVGEVESTKSHKHSNRTKPIPISYSQTEATGLQAQFEGIGSPPVQLGETLLLVHYYRGLLIPPKNARKQDDLSVTIREERDLFPDVPWRNQ